MNSVEITERFPGWISGGISERFLWWVPEAVPGHISSGIFNLNRITISEQMTVWIFWEAHVSVNFWSNHRKIFLRNR